ncbi:MAG: FtsW/RodA/SpoVE family cell cycle protein [Lentisphaerae bacterium]|nr:FtsW/RodA/SpoVE family cell cycle protein [Lentisphaerota bacterium]
MPPAKPAPPRRRRDVGAAGGAVRATFTGRAASAMARWHQRRCQPSARAASAGAVQEGALLADLSAEVWHDALRLMPALLLCGVGIALTYGVCVPVEGAPERLYWRRQIAFLVIGLAAYAVIAKGVFPWSRRLTMRVLYGLCCIVLPVLVLVLGRATGNSTRWLSLAGMPAVQPAEFAKIVLLWVVAEMVNPDPRLDRAMRLRRHLLAVVAVALPAFLVFLERSMGNTALLCASVGTVLLTRWFSWPSLLILATAGVVGLTPVALAIHRIRVPEPAVNVSRLEAQRGSFGPDGPPVGLSVREVKSVVAPSGASGLLSHCPDRFACYLSQYGGWNARQALRCVRIGGERGSGYRQGNITILGYLPRTVQHTDFIYCVLSESFGLQGAALVLGLIGFLIAVVLWRGAASPHPAAWSFAVGFATLIFLQTVIHVGMALRLLPIIGIPLPFVSYGGSFLVTSFAALGLVARYDGPAGLLATTAAVPRPQAAAPRPAEPGDQQELPGGATWGAGAGAGAR